MFYCKMAKSRSVSILAGYMMHKYQISMNQAIETIKAKKRDIDPNISFLGQLKKYEEELGISLGSPTTTPSKSVGKSGNLSKNLD